MEFRWIFFWMEGFNLNHLRPKWANKILKKRGKSEMASISNLKEEANDDEINEAQFQVNLSLKSRSEIISKVGYFVESEFDSFLEK